MVSMPFAQVLHKVLYTCIYMISLQAIEFSQKGEKVPSCILAAGDNKGGLFHGGFKAVMNREFLVQQKITHIVNTAKGLEIFGPKYLVSFL